MNIRHIEWDVVGIAIGIILVFMIGIALIWHVEIERSAYREAEEDRFSQCEYLGSRYEAHRIIYRYKCNGYFEETRIRYER